MDELTQLPAVAECYAVWNKLREEVENYYKDIPRERLPLSQQKEFKAIKNLVIREAERIRLGEITFEDEQMDDELAEEEEVLTSHTHQQMVNMYRKAKYVLCDDDSTWAEQEEAVHTLEQLWNDGFTAAAHQPGKCWQDGLRSCRTMTRQSCGSADPPRLGMIFPNMHWASSCKIGNESKKLSADMKRPPHRATSLLATGWVSSISWVTVF